VSGNVQNVSGGSGFVAVAESCVGDDEPLKPDCGRVGA